MFCFLCAVCFVNFEGGSSVSFSVLRCVGLLCMRCRVVGSQLSVVNDVLVLGGFEVLGQLKV